MWKLTGSIVAFASLSAAQPNNWAEPCFFGECGYDLPPNGPSGHIKIVGDPKAITDITPAAGWVILDCDPNATVQNIRLACSDVDGGRCGHLFEGSGPEHKYVRLPEACSSLPFARIAKAWVHNDPSLASSQGMVRRDAEPPKVYGISIDDNWDEIDESKYGPVVFAAVGASIPELDLSFDASPDISTSEGANSFVENAIQLIKDGGSKSKNKGVPDKKDKNKSNDSSKDKKPKDSGKSKTDAKSKDAGKGKTDTKSKDSGKSKGGKDTAKDSGKGSGDGDASGDKNTTVIIPDKIKNFEYRLPHVKKQCSIDSSSVTLGVDARFKTQASGKFVVALAATGNAKSKKLSAIKGHIGQYISEFNLDITQEFESNIELEATIGFDDFPLLPSMGVPGASIDLSFLKLGLALEVNGHFSGSVHVGVSVFSKISYGMKNGAFDFPESVPLNPYVSTGGVKLKINPNVTTEASISAGIIPKLTFGISAFGKANANLYVAFGGYVDIKAQPKKGGAGGQVLGRLQAVIGAEASLFSLFKAEWDKTFWNKDVTLWKSSGSKKPEIWRAHRGISRRSEQAKFSGNWNDKWLSCSKIDGSKKESVVDKPKLSQQE
ncbi:hypothetical protein ONZ45_g10637 [Pleurotus djamor]|nr:hypothetical protein ONZ45_g10637 [Pleurotus djamor]